MPVTADRYGYLGPEASFTEAASRRIPTLMGARLDPFDSVHAAIDAVRSGEIAGCVVPLENSVEGSVNTTLDELIRGEPVVVATEFLLPVTFTLMARPGTDLPSVRRIITHPVAEAQCRTWLGKNLPDASVALGSSTSAAASAVADETVGADGHPYDAAISAPIAAERYGLVPLAEGIGEDEDAVTRFVVITRPGRPPRATGSDKTSLVAYIRDDHPGALLEILEQFSTRGVNLTRIESRPTGNGMGRYCFVVDAEGHVADARVGEALMGLRRVCADVRYLGSYPRADGVRPPVGRGMTNEDFRDASSWLESLRTGRS
ncbi:prephenate dehydratase [Phytoactinopolyspora halotolerans]|uniref:Prephenate dehydratase n=1 Tax=Phytoactinopolyspora halotolerans TaxID=1981512 RepID=A0A6L9S317_9ACTN|nr:prephenate dehydratase [Phytoactinopolyspora halotolerans]NED99023.1 prephenate dehydratase [Phytoactinopolyspora halotolerans]